MCRALRDPFRFHYLKCGLSSGGRVQSRPALLPVPVSIHFFFSTIPQENAFATASPIRR